MKEKAFGFMFQPFCLYIFLQIIFEHPILVEASV